MNEDEIDRCEFWLTANRLVRQTGEPNYKQPRIQVNEEWDFDYLEKSLKDYHGREEILNYFKYGWPLNVNNIGQQATIPPNQKGAREHIPQLGAFIKKELKRGSIIGPFKRNPFGKEARISPLDTIPKKDSDDLRVIINLSHPFKGDSVNNSIDKDTFLGEPIKLRYPSVDDLAKIVRKKGRGCLIFKRDLEAAYYQMKLDAGDIHLLGFRVEGKLYFFVTLSMGARSSCYCCQQTTNVITYIFNTKDGECVNYLDDLGGADTPDIAKHSFDLLGQIIEKIGIRESVHKAVEPDTRVSFLGILFDSLNMTLSITPERLAEIRGIIKEWLNRSSAKLVDIQSLLGKLNFACNTVRAGRVFVSKIINLLKEASPSEPIRLSDEFRKDLSWWDKYMTTFDGVSIIPNYTWSRPDTVIATDSCLVACGGWNENNREFWHLKFPDCYNGRKDININEKEAMAVMVGLKIWKDSIRNCSVLMHCDNQCTVDVINKGRASNRITQDLLREICFISASANAWIKMVFRPGVDNRIADFCSRIDLDDSYRAKLWEETKPGPITEKFVFSGLLEIESDW